MKNALIVTNLGGFASFLINDIKILQELGYKVYYASNVNTLPWEVTENKLKELNVNIINIDFNSKKPISKSNFCAYMQLKSLINRIDFSVVHCHTPITGLITRLVCRKKRKNNTKIIYTTHGFTFNNSSTKKNWLIYYNLEKFASRMCDAIITINKEDYSNAKTMKCKKVFYLNGVGVKTSKFENIKIDINDYKMSLGIDLNKTIILSVGELSKRKNHQIIIKAIANLPNSQQYIYVICGNGIDGGTGIELKKLANENDVDLRLLGFRKDIPEIIQCCDIGALPSTREGLGMSGLQMLCCGKPVIGSNVQGIKDYIIDNETGYLCNLNSVEEFSEAIKKLSIIQNRNKMSNGCKNMAKKFDIEKSYNNLYNIYKEILF